ncbi:hypothetical protein [Pseudomonas sp. PSE1(2024)]|uniref:hypothetical protein n=1 Tax=Pseudomonas sp. PSE1(2024) TaxID=3228746 RepID=UPI003D9871B3
MVPSKALLARTKKRIIDAEIPELGKIVTHPEMYNELKPARAYVLTQERLARLQTDQPNLHFDIVFVDEAHNLLASDKRSELLASVICIAYSRNPAAAFKYLTPFLNDELSLSLRFVKENLSAFRISEYLKSERFYLCDFREGKGDRINSLYDHFLDRWYSTNKVYSDYFDFIRMNSLGKNIVYANKPKSIEMFAVDFAQSLPPVECPLIQKACIELELNFDKRYLLIECLRKGVVYHHGSMPDTVRYYVERLFSSSTHLKYLVSSSTLLEGVNLPIERLFILDQRKGRSNLDASQFKNLVGRVNRFSEVFSQKGRDALSRLESHVYLVGTDKYSSKRADLQGFYKKTVKVTNKVFDKVSNTLLLSTEINELNKAELKEAVERLENLEPGATSSKDVRRVSTQVGKQLIANSVTEIDIFAKEEKIQKSIEEFFAENSLISSPYELMLAIKMFFIDNLDEGKGYSDLYRLKNEEALKFYSMLIGWKLNKYTIKQVIYNFVKYWNDRGEGEKNLVFVGKWGDTKFPDSHYEHWVDMSKKK